MLARLLDHLVGSGEHGWEDVKTEGGGGLPNLMRATGCNRLVTRIQWVGMEQRHFMRTIELLGDKVEPLVARAFA